jgi:hypothetical protein
MKPLIRFIPVCPICGYGLVESGEGFWCDYHQLKFVRGKDGKLVETEEVTNED